MDMIKLMRKTVYLMLLMGIVQIVPVWSFNSIAERKNMPFCLKERRLAFNLQIRIIVTFFVG